MLMVPPAKTDALKVRLRAPGDLAVDWGALARVASEPNAFLEPWFLEPALAHLAGGKDVRIAQAENAAGRVIGLMPLTIAAHYGRVPARHTANWMHYQCLMGTPLIEAGQETAFWQTLLAALDAEDWAEGFLTISGLLDSGPAHRGLIEAATTMDRPCPTVHAYERATLWSDLDAAAYLETHVRAKKRKELRRLSKRLRDEGAVEFQVLEQADQLESWLSEFLVLEAAGWKGREGAAMANTPQTTAFFREVVAGAFAAGKLDFQRLDLDGRAIAMLVNFRTPPGSWSFKIAYDEALARFSPGVLIELENLPRVLGDPEIEWMDSCAVENHPMIDRLWAERRRIVQVSVPLAGASRRLIYNACRAAETGSAQLRRLLGREKW